MEQGFIDIHCHVVYGIDDGPKTLQESIGMLRAAYKDGVRTLIATSHTEPGIMEFKTDLYLEHLDQLRTYCADEALDMKLLSGAEILYSSQTPRFLRDGRVLTLGKSEYVLVEFLPDVRYSELQDALERILRSGYQPVVAHVERYGCLFGFPKRMRDVKREFEAHLQMNCSTVLGGKGLLRDLQSRRILEENLIDIVASDAHNTSSRKTRMTDTYKYLAHYFGKEKANQLTGLMYDADEIERL